MFVNKKDLDNLENRITEKYDKIIRNLQEEIETLKKPVQTKKKAVK